MQVGAKLNASDRERFRVGDWNVDPPTGRITQGDRSMKLEPRVMDVLVYLAERPGKVVTREELEATVWAGRVVSYDALTSTLQKLRRALADDARQPRIIETVSKKGYRLVAPVGPPDEPGCAHETPGEVPRLRTRRLWRWASAAAALAVVLTAGAALVHLGPWRAAVDSPAREPRLSTIAVLPFDNLGDDPEQEYFADGMTDDLITDLTKISSLFVIDRDSSFAYRGGSRDVREAAQNLNVSYVLHGSVRRVGGFVRINAQLTDTAAGRSLWAERYDGKMSNVFALQDSITRDIVSVLAVRLNPGERQVLARQDTTNPQAYEYFLQGQERYFRYSKEDNREARELYREATELDPVFARAYAMRGLTHVFDFMNGWTNAPELSLDQGYALADKAISLSDALPVAYFVKGLSYRERRAYEKAMAEARKAIAIDPSYANGHVLLATLLYYAGRPEDGLEAMQKAIRLHPHHGHNYPYHVGQAYFILGRYDEAIDTFKRGLETLPTSERLHLWLAAAYVRAGRMDDAEWEASEVLDLNPDFSLKRMEEAYPFKYAGDLANVIDALRLAGLPE